MLVIDPRVGTSKNYTRAEKVEYWQDEFARMNIQTTVQQLEFGDFSWTGVWVEDRPVRVGLEHKTVGDLVGSMRSGRLSGHQIPGMLDQYEFRYLMVEGVVRPGRDGIAEIPHGGTFLPLSPAITFREIVNYLNSVEHLAGMYLRRTFGPTESIAQIGATYLWWQKPWDQHKSMEQMAHVEQAIPTVFHRPNMVERVAGQLPGVGPRKARAIAKRYRTVVDFVEATEKDLRQVPGIGDALSKQIVKALREARK